MMNWQDHRKYYLVYFCILFFLFQLLRSLNGLCLSQLGDAFIFQTRQDPLLWVFTAVGIPSFIIHNIWLCGFLDALIFLLPVMLYFTQKKKHFHLAWVFFLLYGVYLLIAFAYPTLSIRKYLGLALVILIFSANSEIKYHRLIKYFRYYVCFIFVSAALWKMTRGTLFDGAQFSTILITQHFDHNLFFPDHISTRLASFFIGHNNIAYIFYIIVGLFQLSFLLGFFTRKYDKFLALAMILFVIGDFLIMRIEYWEFGVFLPLFFLPSTAPRNKT
ncbi:MAG: hypothetical protein HKN09_08040 [Saprospiraceae bacterium]|nr:hypothetical protein [Saprospiraceae bacterium]